MGAVIYPRVSSLPMQDLCGGRLRKIYRDLVEEARNGQLRENQRANDFSQ